MGGIVFSNEVFQKLADVHNTRVEGEENFKIYIEQILSSMISNRVQRNQHQEGWLLQVLVQAFQLSGTQQITKFLNSVTNTMHLDNNMVMIIALDTPGQLSDKMLTDIPEETTVVLKL
uniref:Uncharacterized protein n=1 Tax=Romanomermis culicivorax TaxID=13658 RepID=A0A915HPH7_ROMCU